jgi:hypothetical protein
MLIKAVFLILSIMIMLLIIYIEMFQAKTDSDYSSDIPPEIDPGLFLLEDDLEDVEDH